MIIHRKSETGFGHLAALLMMIILALVGFTGWYVWQQKNSKENINSYEECAKSGNPIQESYPSVCRTKDGRVFTQSLPDSYGYLEIKEWGVRFKKTTLTQDAEYVIKDEHILNLSTKTYAIKAGNSCGANNDFYATGYVVRGKAGYVPNGLKKGMEDYGDDVKKIGEYYFLWIGPQAPCANPEVAANLEAMNMYQPALAELANNIEAEPVH